jgi:hypothetical protein
VFADRVFFTPAAIADISGPLGSALPWLNGLKSQWS